MLLGGYSRCALGNLPRSSVLRPKTAESGLEPENRVGILALQLERALSQERTSSPSRMTGRAYARHPGSTSVDVDVLLIIFQLVGGVQKRRSHGSDFRVGQICGNRYVIHLGRWSSVWKRYQGVGEGGAPSALALPYAPFQGPRPTVQVHNVAGWADWCVLYTPATALG